MLIARVVALFSLVCLLVSAASAGTIGPICATCQGGIYELSYTPVSSDGTTDVYNVYFAVDTLAYTGPGLYIGAVAPKVSPIVTSAVLLSAPSGSVWDSPGGGLYANGCTSYTGGGFFCTAAIGNGAPISNHLNEWIWQVSIPSYTLFTGENAARIKVMFTNDCEEKVGVLVSHSITLDSQVPEPTTMGFLGAGLIGLYFIRRRLD